MIDDPLNKFLEIRRETLRLCAPLEIEDFVVQPIPQVSPPKWHLGHTTWFFEKFILEKYLYGYQPYNDKFSFLFNSYYKSAGHHWLQAERGMLSRPTVKEIISYRKQVDEIVVELLQASSLDKDFYFLVEIGLHHEQQHQELLLMDIKYILGINPLMPRYKESNFYTKLVQQPIWLNFNSGIYDIGATKDSFSYDNENPRHKIWLNEFSISPRLITNREFLEFIMDNGYYESHFWLDKGWDWIRNKNIRHPLYWIQDGNSWYEFTLHGLSSLNLDASVIHISYFEASAFAAWRKCRLPKEEEFEIFLAQKGNYEVAYLKDKDINIEEKNRFLHPPDNSSRNSRLWCWTESHYSPYPSFKPFLGELAEYNGKFMCGQFVLKGGSFATPIGHYRNSYRNFFEPCQRWMFSGICLAKD